jgi:hypothetical protein
MDMRRARSQQDRQQAAQQNIVENLRREGKHAEADAMEAGLLSGAGVAGALGIGPSPEEKPWQRFTGPDGQEYMWNGDPNTQARPIAGVAPPPEPVPEPEKPPLTPKDQLTLAGGAADKYRTETAGVFEEPLRRYNDIADKDPAELTGAEQRTLIVNYAKMLDPSSAVMESEAQAVEMAGAKMPVFKRWWKDLADGSLRPETVQTIMAEMNQLANKRYEELAQTYTQYSSRLDTYGVTDYKPWIGELPEPPVTPEWMQSQEEEEQPAAASPAASPVAPAASPAAPAASPAAPSGWSMEYLDDEEEEAPSRRRRGPSPVAPMTVPNLWNGF